MTPFVILIIALILKMRASAGLECTQLPTGNFRFGGAFTDAAGINIAHLSSEAQESLIRAYYSDQGGIK